jgi:hypothetical protein
MRKRKPHLSITGPLRKYNHKSIRVRPNTVNTVITAKAVRMGNKGNKDNMDCHGNPDSKDILIPTGSMDLMAIHRDITLLGHNPGSIRTIHTPQCTLIHGITLTTILCPGIIIPVSGTCKAHLLKQHLPGAVLLASLCYLKEEKNLTTKKEPFRLPCDSASF